MRRKQAGIPGKGQSFQSVVLGVVGPHGCKYLSNGPEVFLDIYLIVQLPPCRQKYDADTLGKDMEERDGH